MFWSAAGTKRVFKVEERRRRGVVMRKYIYVALVAAVVLISGSANAVILPVHQYTFNDGTVSDTGTLANAPGTMMGNAFAFGGVAILDGSAGTFVDLPGGTIAINTLTNGFTLELWEQNPTDNQGYSMSAAFGGTQSWWGQNYVAISTTRGDNVSRGMMSRNDNAPGYQTEVGENGPELYDGLLHQYVVSVGNVPCVACVDSMLLSFYIDGKLQGMHIIDGRTIAGIETTWAYLGKSLYPGDAAQIANIDEFNIYDYGFTCDEVVARYAEGPAPLPEPATLTLLGLGSLALLRRRR
jgi:hypothetical protein